MRREMMKDDFMFRFGEPLSEKELLEKWNLCVPKGTRNKTDWAVSVFRRWQEERRQRSMNDNIALTSACLKDSILDMETTDINTAMKYFIFEARKVDGATLYGLFAAMASAQKKRNPCVNLFEDEEFVESRRSLDAAMRERSAAGLGSSASKNTEAISDDEENRLWEKGALGESNPQQLLDAMVYLTGLNFALRGGAKHRNLRLFRKPQITGPHKYSSGRSYWLYTEDISKTNAGGVRQRKLKPKQVRAYENVTNSSRCYVRLYKKYKSLCVKSISKTHAFYFTPMKKATVDKWYIDSPVGHNTLQNTVKRICKVAGIEGLKPNHSLRATAATRMYRADMDEQLICEQIGHRSSAARVYKRSSDDQKALVSDVVNAKIMKTEDVATSSTDCKLNEVACTVSSPCADVRDASVTSSKLDRGNVSFTFNFN